MDKQIVKDLIDFISIDLQQNGEDGYFAYPVNALDFVVDFASSKGIEVNREEIRQQLYMAYRTAYGYDRPMREER